MLDLGRGMSQGIRVDGLHTPVSPQAGWRRFNADEVAEVSARRPALPRCHIIFSAARALPSLADVFARWLCLPAQGLTWTAALGPLPAPWIQTPSGCPGSWFHCSTTDPEHAAGAAPRPPGWLCLLLHRHCWRAELPGPSALRTAVRQLPSMVPARPCQIQTGMSRVTRTAARLQAVLASEFSRWRCTASQGHTLSGEDCGASLRMLQGLDLAKLRERSAMGRLLLGSTSKAAHAAHLL